MPGSLLLKRILTIAVLATVMLGGCTQTKMSPDEYMKFCTNRVKYWSVTLKNELQHFMGVSKEKMPEVFCRRVMVGLQSGRITMKDLIEVDNKASPVWQVIKGR
jgi:hypothetical protein